MSTATLDIHCICGYAYPPSLFKSCPECNAVVDSRGVVLGDDAARKFPSKQDLATNYPRFNITEALAGKPFIHIADLPKIKPYTHIFTREGEHPAVFAWCGEWVSFEGEDGFDTMHRQLRMLGGAK